MPFLIQLVVTLLIIGLLLWLVNFIPLDPQIRSIIHVVVVVFVVIWLIYLLLGAYPTAWGPPLRR